uniref:Amidase domain-containing protein n=1 Tax=Bionectria ochroleuca TaxID=29856 RepID=A0A8H7N5D9_BIOOC
MSWEPAAREVREALESAIPPKWKLPKGFRGSSKDVTRVPLECGLLSEEEIRITELDASSLVSKLSTGKLSAAAVTEAFCGRAAIAHQLVNCLTVFFPEQARKRAAELDEHFKRTGKPIGPLHGVPIALKDTFDVPGYPTTWGYAASWKKKANRESAIVAVLREAGAVFYCKTTMPQTGMLLETVSNLFGRTLSPFNPAFGSGGSSGGDGALVAMKGSPFAPSTDIGGSIRAPAAFNGLYGIRPSADRIPKRAMKSVESGQLNIRVSCGPVCHSTSDLKLMTKVVTTWPSARYDTASMPVPWREVDRSGQKLAFGLWEFDGTVMPHPPILRALRESAEKLRKAGHEVINIKIPIDFWEASEVYMRLYYQCGIEDSTKLLAEAGETMMPAAQKCVIYTESKTNLLAREKLSRYREILSDFWDGTKTSTGRPMDGILCPVSSVAGYPHDFLPYWGYTCFFNLVDYPSTILPVKDIKINARDDPKYLSYQPQENPFDTENRDIYDPDLWSNQPVTIQIVARPFDDEELLSVTEVVDHVVNPAQKPML